MREILFRGKSTGGIDKWIEGTGIFNDGINTWISFNEPNCAIAYGIKHRTVLPETVGQFTGLTDKNGKKIFEGDIVQYQTFDDFDCQSVVKFGEYKQDGSGGEYSGNKCIGFYVEVDNFTCPDWCEDDPDCFPYFMKQQNILEVANECEIIGNIYDNFEMLEGGANNDSK